MRRKKFVYFYILLILPLVLLGCTAENTLIKEATSPNGEYRALAFERGAGATTEFSTQVSLYKKDAKIDDEAGNVFIGSGSQFIDIYWEGDSTLVIVHDREKRKIYKQVNKKHGVEIKYLKKNIEPLS